MAKFPVDAHIGFMDPKPRPNQEKYLEVLRRMTSEQRLMKAFELSEMAKQLCLAGMRKRHPNLTKAEVMQLYIERVLECPSRNC